MTRPAGAPISPVAVLAIVALLPAALLWSCWRWADAQATDADAPPPTSSTVVAPPDPHPALATPLASMRRTPAALARDLNVDAFSAAARPFLDSLNDRSCGALSVDGYAVGSRNAELAVLPASNIKIVVAAAALEILGADFTYTTRVVGPAVSGGVISGDVYLVGGGDPLLSSDWYPTSDLEVSPVFNATSLDSLADDLVAAGVDRIDGRLLGDGSRYDDELYAPGWGPGVAGLEAGPYDALMANDSRVLGDAQRAADPVEAAARELVRLLDERGVTVTGGAGVGVAPEGIDALAALDSQPLTAIVAEMLSNSDNNTAELIVKELGLATAGDGTRAAGLAAIRATLDGWGIDVSSIVLADGSGLSLENRFTCAAMLEVLQRSGLDGPIGQGLAIAGQTGTLVGVFTDSTVTGRLRAKTGTLGNPPFNADPPAVKALSGYLPVDGGSAIEFTLLLNGPTINDQSEYRPYWDALVDLLASYPAVAGPAALAPR